MASGKVNRTCKPKTETASCGSSFTNCSSASARSAAAASRITLRIAEPSSSRSMARPRRATSMSGLVSGIQQLQQRLDALLVIGLDFVFLLAALRGGGLDARDASLGDGIGQQPRCVIDVVGGRRALAVGRVGRCQRAQRVDQLGRRKLLA